MILDVVYNHRRGQSVGTNPQLPWGRKPVVLQARGRDPRYYADYTGCGNTLNASAPKVLQLIMDSLRYWVEEMHVDGSDST